MSSSKEARSLLDRTDHNREAARYLGLPQALTAGIVVGVVLGLATWWWLGLAAGVIACAAVAFVLPRSASAGLGRVFDARSTSEAEFPRYHNLMEGLAITSGSVAPELMVVDEPRPNLAVYGPPDAGVVVATTGLLEHLDRVELEGVLAEALVRLRSHDAELGSQAAAFVCGPLVRNGPVRDGRPMAIVTPFAAARSARLRRVLGDQREFLSDLGAVDITRYPPGLGSALEKLEHLGPGVESATWGTAHLWLADPLVAPSAPDPQVERLNALFGAGAPIDQRASLMAEL
jgi:heat shock protein HtpX